MKEEEGTMLLEEDGACYGKMLEKEEEELSEHKI